MCTLSKKDQYVCQSHHRIAEAATSVLGDAQFSAGPFYYPRSSRCRFGHPREATVGAGNVSDSNGISNDFKRQNRSHHTEPVPSAENDDVIKPALRCNQVATTRRRTAGYTVTIGLE